MKTPFGAGVGWDVHDLNLILLDGPPPDGFDCGRNEQNRFLYETAWRDHQAMLSVTRLIYVKGIFAAYLTTLADAIELGSREKALVIAFFPRSSWRRWVWTCVSGGMDSGSFWSATPSGSRAA